MVNRKFVISFWYQIPEETETCGERMEFIHVYARDAIDAELKFEEIRKTNKENDSLKYFLCISGKPIEVFDFF